MGDKANKVVGAMSLLGSGKVVISALGFLKNLLAAYYFGTSSAMDTYLLALVVPDIAMFMATTGLFNFIPIFAREKEERGSDEAWRSAGKMVAYWLALLGGLLGLTFVFTPAITTLTAPGVEGAQRLATINYTRVLVFMSLSMGLARILAAILLAQKRFFIPAFSEVVFQAGSMSYLVIFHSRGIEAFVWGMVLGGFLQLGVTALVMSRQGVRIPVSVDMKHPTVRKMARLTVPVYIGNAGGYLNKVFIRAFASTLPAGAVSSLQYAFLVIDPVLSIISTSLSGALFPFLSYEFAKKNEEGFTRGLNRGLVALSLVLMPAAAGIFLLAEPIVRLVYERGMFDAHSTTLTVAALRVYSPAMLAGGLNTLLVSIYHARQNTALPMKAGLLRVALIFLSCWLFIPYLGHVGLALAVTLGEHFKLGILLYFLRHTAQRSMLAQTFRSMGKLVQAVAVMALVVYPLTKLEPVSNVSINFSSLLFLAVPVVAGILVYSLALYFLSNSEFSFFYRFLKQATWGRLPHSRLGTW